MLSGSILLAAIYGRVALLNLTSGVVGGDADGYDNVWNNWWVKTALLDLHRSPLYNDYIYYPIGISLRYHTLNPLNGLLTMPFNWIFGYLPTLNLLLVVALVPTLFCAFLLLRDQVGNPWAAFAGAALFTYANRNVLFFFSLGQTNMITMHWLPLYLFLVLRALHGRPIWSPGGAPALCSEQARSGRDRRRWMVYAVFAVAALVAMSLTDWQYVMYAVLVTVFYFLFMLATRRTWGEKRAIFARLAAIGGVYTAIVALPLVLPMIQEAAVSPWLAVGYQSTVHSSDLLDLLGLGLGNPGYLAVGVAALGLGAAWKRGNRERELGLFWGCTALLFYLITLGPKLIINGQITDIPMLYSLIQNLPVLNIGRDPGRFNIVALLGVSTLVAFGLRAVLDPALRSRTSARFSSFQQQLGIRYQGLGIITQNAKLMIPTIVVAGFLSVSLFGFMAAIGPASNVDAPDWPAFYQEIAQDKEQYAILELPVYPALGRGATHYNMYQVLHEKLRFAGRLARDHKQDNPNNFVKTASLFRHFWLLDAPLARRDLSYPHQDFLTHTDYATQGIPLLNYYNTRYIVLYKEAIKPDDWRLYDALLSQVLGSGVKPYRDEKLVRVYKIPAAAPAPANPLTLDVGTGWFHSDVNPAGHVYRWADNTSIDPGTGLVISPVSEFYTMNLGKEPVRADFNFTAFTWKVPRTVRVALNGHEVASIALQPEDPGKRVTVEMVMPSGNNKIVLSSPEPPQPTGDAKDKRLLSFGMSGVGLQAK